MPGRIITFKEKPEGLENTLLKIGFEKKNGGWENRGVKIMEHNISRDGQSGYILRISLSGYAEISAYEELKKHLPRSYAELTLKE